MSEGEEEQAVCKRNAKVGNRELIGNVFEHLDQADGKKRLAELDRADRKARPSVHE